jgi:S-DNA-T family DNA segregation ATPase FtsK/SpoIIIE
MKKEKKKKSNVSQDRVRELSGFSLILLGIYLLAGLFSFSPVDSHAWSQDWPRQNWAGPPGDIISHWMIRLLGYSAFFIPVFLAIWGWFLFRKKQVLILLWNSLLAAAVLSWAMAVAGLLHISYHVEHLPAAGAWGVWLADFLFNTFGYVGCWLVLFALLGVWLFLGTEINFSHWVDRLKILLLPKPKEKPEKPAGEVQAMADRETVLETDQAEELFKEPTANKTAERSKSSKLERPVPRPSPEQALPPRPRPRSASISAEYQKAFLALLNEDRDKAVAVEEDKSQILLEKLAEFGVEGEIIERHSGPVITRYEFKPAPGVKVNQIANLADDLALAMQAHRIRILAPIPGKGVVGIEIPNRHRSMVLLKPLLTSPAFAASGGRLTMALGRTITGEPCAADLAEMPHLLVAGSTGSGKSVCLNTIITSLLYHLGPEDLHFIMIDPKRIELSVYRGIPHLQFQYRVESDAGKSVTRSIEGVVTDPQEVLQVFRLAVSEMEGRYKILAKEGCRNIEDFNRKSSQRMSYLIIVIDELADLMLSREAGEIESRIAKLAQMARAVGIHLVVATQRPSVDVITGVIKANFPARIAFQVASKTDSRTILDINGAESLLGRGDMLYIPPGQAEAVRLHGPFISTQETERVVAYLKETYGSAGSQTEETGEGRGETVQSDYSMEMTVPQEPSGDGGRDEMFDEAKALVIRHQQGSVSLLQRRLKLGYSRAARLIDQLEAAGVVGPFDGSKAREVLIKNEEGVDA